jgi:hypothetical protein
MSHITPSRYDRPEGEPMGLKTSMAVLTLVLTLAGCGGGPPDRAGRYELPKGGEGISSLLDPCAGLSDGEAAALLGTPAGDVERSELGPMVGGGCSLKSRSQMTKSIVFVLHREGSLAAGRAAFEQQKAGFEAVVPAREVAGLGDEAAWFGSREPVVLKRLLVRKGNVWLDVVAAPDDLAGSQKVAQVVLRKLQ